MSACSSGWATCGSATRRCICGPTSRPDKQARQGQPPLVLRLVVAHNGKHPVYLVTSVLSRKRLTDAQVVELYARRWGIEVFYRHVKQTFQRRKLRSTSADNALLEMHWSLAGLWAMALYALVQLQIDHSPPQPGPAHQNTHVFQGYCEFLTPGTQQNRW